MQYESLLPNVQKPSRYIGNERNSVKKTDALFSMALVFPDLYEIGMSHLGLKILYESLNARKDTRAERLYAPWTDLEEQLRATDTPLPTLESRTPLADLDMIGFTLPYELTFTNILNILDLGKIPLLSSERSAAFPLVIGGGSSVFNPEPVADFFDLFFIGDAEEAIHEIADILCRFKEQHNITGNTGDAGAEVQDNSNLKEKLLEALSVVEGVYIPSWYDVTYCSSGEIEKVIRRKGPKPLRRVVADLDRADFPTSLVLPHTRTVHDRVSVEVSRGCTTGCRFCQAGFTNRPVRERSIGSISNLVDKSLKCTGYSEFTLASLNTGEYNALLPLVKQLNSRYKGEKISFSVPSMRAGTLNKELLQELKTTRKSGLTIAPEAGSERLRRAINKFVSEEDLLNSISEALEEGWRSLKLYFMLGLPTETEEDLDETVSLGRQILAIGRQARPRPKKIKFSFSTFVPKPHTPFQWVGQISMDEIRQRQKTVKNGLRHKMFQVETHPAEMSFLEAALSRGDRRLGRVILEAWKNGARFDAWSDRLDFNIWKKAFDECGLNPEFYANRMIETNQVLPWDHIGSNMLNKTFLVDEFNRAAKEEYTPDCRFGQCTACGACDISKEIKTRLAPKDEIVSLPRKKTLMRHQSPVKNSYMLSYSKTGPIRFISHIDLIQLFYRALRMSGIPIVYSQGFNPHMKVSFGPPLPLGMESEHEVMLLVTNGFIDTDFYLSELERLLPDGINCHDLTSSSAGISKIRSIAYRFSIASDQAVDIRQLLDNGRQVSIKGKKEIALDSLVLGVKQEENMDKVEYTLEIACLNGNPVNITGLLDTIFENGGPKASDIFRTRISWQY